MPQPSLSPIEVYPLVCIECSRPMRSEIISMGTGTKPKKLNRVVYFCDTCQYGFEITKQHASGTHHKYVEFNPASKAANG